MNFQNFEFFIANKKDFIIKLKEFNIHIKSI